MGKEDSKTQQRQVQGIVPGEERPWAPAQAGTDLLEGNSVEKDLEVLVEKKLL